MPVWSPELVVDEPLVRRLLSQFPELEVRSLQKLAEGWDNSVWLVDERYAFRFPRREVAIPGLEREIAVLPELAPRLPLPASTRTSTNFRTATRPSSASAVSRCQADRSSGRRLPVR